MSKEVATRQTELQPAGNMLDVVARAASDPTVDVAKMQALLDMQKQLEDRQAMRDYIDAEKLLHEDMPVISKRGSIKNKAGNVQSRYAKWEDLHRTISPLLRKYGFTLTFECETQDGMLAVQGVLSHVGGHVKQSGFMKLPQDTSGSKNSIQGVGSAMSYGKRYVTILLLNISTEGEDDDGQTVTAQIQHTDDLIERSEKAARKGIDDYQNFWDGISKEDRRRLSDTGQHDKNKTTARKAGGDDFPGDR